MSRETERESGEHERDNGTQHFPARRAPLIIHHYVNGNARHGHHWAVPRRCLSMRGRVSKKRALPTVRYEVCDVPPLDGDPRTTAVATVARGNSSLWKAQKHVIDK